LTGIDGFAGAFRAVSVVWEDKSTDEDAMPASSQNLSPLHTDFIDRFTAVVATDARFDAVLGAGSLIHGGFDAHSDLDFVVVVTGADYPAVMAARDVFAAQFGDLISAFTGEHVGEPRLLICLYGPRLLHVDFKFVRACDLNQMVERPIILWARDEVAITAVLDEATVRWPDQSPDWFEARAWIWLHYGATKLQRGELFEAISMLGFFRDQVLGPMLLRRHGRDQRGVRRIEQLGPEVVAGLQMTHPDYDAKSVSVALKASAMLYLELRGDAAPSVVTAGMPEALLPFFEI
jgi:hypothetical protein